jgi:hypothetical protein
VLWDREVTYVKYLVLSTVHAQHFVSHYYSCPVLPITPLRRGLLSFAYFATLEKKGDVIHIS